MYHKLSAVRKGNFDFIFEVSTHEIQLGVALGYTREAAWIEINLLIFTFEIDWCKF